MPLFARKLVNAADLLWGSLDERERMILAYGVCYALVAVAAAFRGRGRERLKREVVSELTLELADELRRRELERTTEAR